MILQLGSILSSVLGGAPGASFGSILGGAISRGVSALAPLALGVGQQFASQLINRELTRSSRNDLEAALKADLRAAANAVSPMVSPGQTPVFSGGPATGSAFIPATFLPPSIQPPQRILQTNPNFFSGQEPLNFQTERRPPDLFLGDSRFPVSEAGVGGLVSAGARFLRQFGRGSGMKGLTATAIGVEAGAIGAGMLLDPSTAFAPGRGGGFPLRGDPLTITDEQIQRSRTMPAHFTGVQVPTGLPARGVFEKEANGCLTQWYFWDGDMSKAPQPVDRGAADMVKREFIYRLNVFTGKFIRLKSKRMNPMNVRAFFRAGRRVDAGRRICMKMFSEHRRDKKGSVRRKSSHKKKR